jgi:hypothetical protein
VTSTKVFYNIVSSASIVCVSLRLDLFGICSHIEITMAKETHQKIGEPVKILASFGINKIQIHFFSWQDRTYKVGSMNLFHIGRDGDQKYYHFAVSAIEGGDGEPSRTTDNTYQLSFNPTTLVWQLEDIIEI